jgi:CubicO group peptidase (beta-lactamase class C family)
MKHESIFNLLGSKEYLQEKLVRNFAGKDSSSGVSATIISNGRVVSLQHGIQPGNFTSSTGIPVACITKSMTATLVAMATRDHGIALESPVTDLLPASWFVKPEYFRAITLQHLLSHTHGLDDCHVLAAPRHGDGRTDTRALLDKLSLYTPMFAPGTHFSYSNPCYWLIAGVLEFLYGRDYTGLLQQRLFEPLGIVVDENALTAQPVCPALSHDLRLSSEDLCRILSLYLQPSVESLFRVEGLDQLLAHSSPTPGWSAKEKSAHCGWRGYGQNWYGHNGRVGGYMAMVRFNPEANIALAVTGTDQRSSDTAYRALFGDILPEFSDSEIMPPAMLSAAQWEQSDRQRFHGVYQNSRWQLHLDFSDNKHLRLKAYDRTTDFCLDAPTIKRFLKPAEKHVFLTVPSDPINFPFLQFIHPDVSGFQCLWNGSTLWKKV